MSIAAEPARRRLSWQVKLSFSLLILLVFVVILELAARMVVAHVLKRPPLYQSDPVLGYVLRPNLDVVRKVGPDAIIRIRTDAEGKRLVPEPKAPATGETILLIGDSCAFGDAVNEDETVAAHLAAAGYRVVVLAAPGYGSVQELLYFRKYAAAHPGEFSWVIVLVSSNDALDVRSDYVSCRHRPYATWDGQSLTLKPFASPWHDKLCDWSTLFWSARQCLPSYRIHEGDGPALVGACLAKLKEEAEAAGARTAFLIVLDLGKPDEVAPVVEAVQRQNVPLRDPTAAIHRRIATGEFRWKDLLAPDGVHWSNLGNRVLTDELLKIMRQN
jgi:hypothetical protein